MDYFHTLMQHAAILCLSLSLKDAGTFLNGIDRTRLTPTQYITVLAETATRVAGCAKYDAADAFVFASNLTARVGGLYDPADADQSLSYLGLMTSYTRLEATDFTPDNASAELSKVAALWLAAWLAVDARIDPKWTPGQVFAPFQPSRPVLFHDGATPDSIDDPEVRREYERYLAGKEAFLRQERQQTLFRRAAERYAPEFKAYFTYLDGIDPDILGRLRTAAQRLKDRDLRSCFRLASPPP